MTLSLHPLLLLSHYFSVVFFFQLKFLIEPFQWFILALQPKAGVFLKTIWDCLCLSQTLLSTFQTYSVEHDEAVKLTFNKTFDAACWSWFMAVFLIKVCFFWSPQTNVVEYFTPNTKIASSYSLCCQPKPFLAYFTMYICFSSLVI